MSVILKLPGDFLSPCGKLEDDVFGPIRSEKASEPAGRWHTHTNIKRNWPFWCWYWKLISLCWTSDGLKTSIITNSLCRKEANKASLDRTHFLRSGKLVWFEPCPNTLLWSKWPIVFSSLELLRNINVCEVLFFTYIISFPHLVRP